jgi:hypothetical protein
MSIQQNEVKLCEVCWKEQDGLAVRAFWFPAGVPMCEEHYLLVCRRCQRQWYTGYDILCDGCRVLQKTEDERRKAYNEHLNSKQWWQIKKNLRRESPRENGRAICSRCGMSEYDNKQTYGEGLHGHHKTYERFGQEKTEDAELLCTKCHAWEHGNPLPKTTQETRLLKSVLWFVNNEHN